jgi:DNA-binding CsgD family transcriptional regulator
MVRLGSGADDPRARQACVAERKVSVTIGEIGRTIGRRGGALTEYLEMWVDGARERVPLEGDRISIGQSSSNDLALPFDRTVSRVHAVLERVASRWVVRDLGSRNGTFVNGERVFGERPIQTGDEIRVGTVLLLARGDAVAEGDRTIGAETGPELTRREREVLVALCRPMLSEGVFREPATVRQIAAELVVSEAAVKQHLQRLYDKFGLHEREGRRARLANEAIRRGLVSTAEIVRGRTRRDPA